MSDHYGDPPDPINEMSKAVVALALEVPAEVHDDVAAKWEAVREHIKAFYRYRGYMR